MYESHITISTLPYVHTILCPQRQVTKSLPFPSSYLIATEYFLLFARYAYRDGRAGRSIARSGLSAGRPLMRSICVISCFTDSRSLIFGTRVRIFFVL